MPETGATATFRVVGEGEFPHGFRCTGCHRPMDTGQPYGSRLTGIDAATGYEVTELVCAYCAIPPDDGEPPTATEEIP